LATGQETLVTALSRVRAALSREPAGERERLPRLDDESASPLTRATELFGLSDFELDVLVLCAGIELEGDFGQLCASAHNSPGHTYPTFGLALAFLGSPHWSALSPNSPLRYWRLIELRDAATLTGAALKIDERILHLLQGVEDELADSITGFQPLAPWREMAAAEKDVAERVAMLWTHGADGSPAPLMRFAGVKTSALTSTAAHAARAAGIRCELLHVHSAPSAPSETAAFVKLVEREMLLRNCALVFDCGEDNSEEAAATHFLQRIRGPVVVLGGTERVVSGRPSMRFEVAKPTPKEQEAIWRSLLAIEGPELDEELESLVGQYDLCYEDIQAAAEAARVLSVDAEGKSRIGIAWRFSRDQARAPLDALAQRVATKAAWDDLVLPSIQIDLLREIASHVKHRAQVYEDWGFAAGSGRGLGLCALFWGASGTGKTMAAEVLANTLELDLFRIDLSAMVSKYIGETEKNLRQIFDAAEESGAILLFDEADALFGKRSEVKDSHDRYANIEVGYLLQRLEAFRGLAVLTTNLRESLDSAFSRRIRFNVEFPFPDSQMRAKIWQRAFPAQMPSQDLDFARLAQFNIAGGSIHSIALQSAFFAASEGNPVLMSHVLRAARFEYEKLGRPMGDNELKGWQ
jgi:hypothetical protein